MATLCYITKDAYHSKLVSEFKPYTGNLTKSDVATLIETLESALNDITSSMIVDVLRNKEGFFLFLVEPHSTSNFDFFDYLNIHYNDLVVISPVNAKFMFTQAMSKGLYTEPDNAYPDPEEDDDEVGTGYMDTESIDIPHASVYLIHERDSTEVQFTPHGTVLGRSKKTADYVVVGNINVSRPHMRVYMDGVRPMISDLTSSNGTYLNGDKVLPDHDREVSNGDIVMLADEKFRVEFR